MGEHSKIEWTDHTFNPWWGCQRVSPGCENCYAETFSKRVGLKVWGPTTERRFFGEKHWNEPLKWNAKAERDGVRRRVFCASMADVFEDRADLAPTRALLYRRIRQTPALDWLLLTKRPQNAYPLWAGANVDDFDGSQSVGPVWGSNVWLGTTVEDQARAEQRIPALAAVPARVRFLSCEPLLGPVRLRSLALENIDWVICGGESGHGARPMRIEWARDLRDQCNEAGIAFHFKQWGEYRDDVKMGKKAAGRELDGRTWNELPARGAA